MIQNFQYINDMKVTDKSRQELFELYKGSRLSMEKIARIQEM